MTDESGVARVPLRLFRKSPGVSERSVFVEFPVLPRVPSSSFFFHFSMQVPQNNDANAVAVKLAEKLQEIRRYISLRDFFCPKQARHFFVVVPPFLALRYEFLKIRKTVL